MKVKFFFNTVDRWTRFRESQLLSSLTNPANDANSFLKFADLSTLGKWFLCMLVLAKEKIDVHKNT